MAHKKFSPIFHIALILGVIILTIPALMVRGGDLEFGAGWDALLFGLAILGAAFMLSWAAEVSEMDISQGFALALLALVAVLPEYAVDMVFAWKAGQDPSFAPLALANMTGANRLLIGVGWPTVMVIYFLRTRKKTLQLDDAHSTEIFYLTCATVYAFSIPFKNSLSLLDAAVLIAIFGAYIIRTIRSGTEEPELVGPAAMVGALRPMYRRLWTILFFLYSAVIIFFSAEPFAESLVAFGRQSGWDEFLLVQWLAPLASEAPEFLVASIWATRRHVQAALGALISSKVNQWTLLVGTLPIVYSIACGKISALPLDFRQDHEIWLTAGQSIFAVAILANRRISWYGAVLLAVLFAAQLIFTEIRMEVLAIYIAFAVLILIRDRKHLLPAAKIGLKFK
ncbi:MAG: sodium:calcium antiporter [candidate division Zixibacteria bacterium]|nr:sodium:calcium antiporter [candidate division Zixibacteria bacterium]